MEHNSFLIHVLYYLAAAVIAVPLFKKIGLGAILGYLSAGVVLGPYGLGLIHDPAHVLHFAEFGVIMLLFLIGLELAPQKLWNMRTQIAVTGGSQLGFTAILIAGVVLALSFPSQQALILGLTLGLSSTAFAVQLMAENSVLASPIGRQGFSILLLQDLAVIPILLLVDSLAVTQATSDAQPWWLGVGALALVLIIGRFAMNPVLNIIANYGSREVMTAAALLIVLGVAFLMEHVGLSMGLGAFTAGILLANSKYRHQLETDIEPFKGILLGLFFIAVGMTMNLPLLKENPVFIISCAIGLIAIKTGVIYTILRLQKNCSRESLQLALMLSQGGEFAFVVMGQATGLELVPTDLADQVILIVGLSMALTSPLVVLQRKLWHGESNVHPQYDKHWDEHDPEVLIAGFGRFGQVVGRMLAANHIPFTALDKDASHVEFVKKFGNKIFFGDATRLDLLEHAGIAKSRLLVICVDDIDESLTIATLIREKYPKIKIIARAHNRMHAYKLHDLKIETVIRETFESSLSAAANTLMQLGYTEGQALERTDMFRLHDEKILMDAVQHYDNQDKLLAIAAEGRKELEQLFSLDDDHH